MTFNRLIILSGLAFLLVFTNPGHNRHREQLSPVFVDYVNRTGSTSGGKDWTFLPAKLDYRNYYVFSTSQFPQDIPTQGTAAEGNLTIGALGAVFVLFPSKP